MSTNNTRKAERSKYRWDNNCQLLHDLALAARDGGSPNRNQGRPDYAKRLDKHREETKTSEDIKVLNSLDYGELSGWGAISVVIGPSYWEDIQRNSIQDNNLVAKLVRDVGRTYKNETVIIPEAIAFIDSNSDDSSSVYEPITLPMTHISSHVDVDNLSSITNKQLPEVVLIEDLIQNLRAQIDHLIINGTGESGEPQGMINYSDAPTASYQGEYFDYNRFGRTIIELLAKTAAANNTKPDTIVFHPRVRQPLYTTNRYIDHSQNNIFEAPAPVIHIAGIKCYISNAIPGKLNGTSIVGVMFNSRNVFISESSLAPIISAEVINNSHSIRFTARSRLFFSAERKTAGVGLITQEVVS